MSSHSTAFPVAASPSALVWAGCATNLNGWEKNSEIARTRADEIIGILRRLWSEEVVSYESDNYRFGPVRFEPKPLQRPSIPIEVGGTSPAALRRAALLGDGWIEIGSADIDEIARCVTHIKALRADAGLAAQPFEVTVGGEWATDLDTVRRIADAGATRILSWPASTKPLEASDVEAWAMRFREDFIEPMSEGQWP
jgi:alkanesulfonate monooxygenase SsuD/methylene tetrahydromethanopterin reductase-like flavin-dependent oxidoreductase (luciferase family)